MYRVKEMGPSEYPRLKSIVSNICQKTGISTPKLMLAQIPIPNAFAYGSPITGKRVAVTTGLLDNLEEEEVEAVLGHELGHLKHRDVQVMMFASFLPAIFYYIGFSLMMSSSYGTSRNRQGGSAVAVGAVAMAMYWILTLFVLGLSRLREYYADQHAVQYVPDGSRKLSEGLAKIVTYSKRQAVQRQTRGINSFRTLFISDPGTAQNDYNLITQSRRISDSQLVQEVLSRRISTMDRITEILSTHPNIVKRLRALQSTT
jgi:heat shock protein HtpX